MTNAGSFNTYVPGINAYIGNQYKNYKSLEVNKRDTSHWTAEIVVAIARS